MNDIIINGLCVSFGSDRVLSDFSAVFPAGKVACIMGPSGSGKTTLLNAILGLVPYEGSITGAHDARVLFQEDRLCEDFSAFTNVRIAACRGITREEIKNRLIEFGLGDSPDKPVRELSGGMKRRAALCRALCAGGDVLLLDEPFKGLDEKTRAAAVRLLEKYRDGRTVICITHDPEEPAMLGADVINLA